MAAMGTCDSGKPLARQNMALIHIHQIQNWQHSRTTTAGIYERQTHIVTAGVKYISKAKIKV